MVSSGGSGSSVKGAVVAQWVWSWFNLKNLCAKGRRFKSSSGHLIQRKFSMKRKNSMIYGPTTTVLHSRPSDTYWARLGKKNATAQSAVIHCSFWQLFHLRSTLEDVVAQKMWSWFNLKTFCGGSIINPVILFRENFL